MTTYTVTFKNFFGENCQINGCNLDRAYEIQDRLINQHMVSVNDVCFVEEFTTLTLGGLPSVHH